MVPLGGKARAVVEGDVRRIIRRGAITAGLLRRPSRGATRVRLRSGVSGPQFEERTRRRVSCRAEGSQDVPTSPLVADGRNPRAGAFRGRFAGREGWKQEYAEGVRTLILEPSSSGLDELLRRRSRSGLDRLDEVWKGVRHMVPAPSGEHADITQQLAVILDRPARAAGLVPTMGEFNLGESEHDYRVPDGGMHRVRPRGVWFATAALVVEIVSPGDESWEKLPFYARCGVEEIVIVDPDERAVHWLALADGDYQPIARSHLVELGPADLAERIDWPKAE
jgi:Uma2 family endonuclease